MTVLRELVRHHDSGSQVGMLATHQAVMGTNDWRVPRLDRQTERSCTVLPRVFSNRTGGMFVAGMLAAAGAFFAWQAVMLDLGGIASPGPGFLPLVLGAFIILGGALIGIDSWRSGEGEVVELGHRDVLVVITALLGVPLIFERLGAYISLALFATVILALIGRISLLRAIPAAILGLAACWWFFHLLLGVQLPSGPW
jgi:hypothetical protein